jgi:glucose-6-phosphate isomerase
LSPLFLRHPQVPHWLDATLSRVSEAELDALPWTAAFTEMAEVEAGERVNSDEDRAVGHYWLRAPELAPTVGHARAIDAGLEQVRDLADAILSGAVTTPEGERFTDVIHLGIGGSTLGPNLLVDALAPAIPEEKGALPVWFVDNTDPDGIERLLHRLGDALATTLVVVVSKSGSTPETRNGMLLVRDALARRSLSHAGRFVAITQDGSRMDEMARVEGWLRRLPMWDWVGGRYSVTSAVGLLPGALAGVDIAAFLAGAAQMDAWTRTPDWRDNPAALLAGCWHVAGHGRGDRNLAVIPYSDRLALFAKYLQQLVMESIGKRLDRAGAEVRQGLTVYGNKGSTDQHAYVQQLRDGRDDALVHFVQVLGDGEGSALSVEDGVSAGDFLQGFLLGTRRALADDGRPSLTLTIPQVDAQTFGGLVALWERAVGLYAGLIGINAYHQPGVEAGKKAAATLLNRSLALRATLSSEAQSTAALAGAVEMDPIEAFYLLERLAATGRAVRTEDGSWRKTAEEA